MDSNWSKVFSTKLGHQAHIVVEVLKDYDIDAVMIDKQDSSYHLGYFEVLVPKEQVIKASHIINEKIQFK